MPVPAPASAPASASAPAPAATYTLGGSVSGLGSNNGLVLANGSTTASVPAAATTFAFSTALSTGTAYAISVQSSPAGLTCTVAGGSGTISANVNNVVVTCSQRSFALGGTLTLAPGSSAGAGISGLVLANGTDTLSVPAGATTFTMPTAVAYSSSYQVTVKTQPAGMSCVVSPASPATMPASAVTSVAVTCTDQPFQLGGTVTVNGPAGVSLSDQGLMLTNTSNGDTYTLAAAAGSFTMPKSVAYGADYALSVTGQPAGLICAVSNGSGKMPAANLSLTVTCADQAYPISGTVTITSPAGVSGLSDQGLVLTNSANNDAFTFSSNGSTFAMSQSVPYGSAYSLSATTQPAGLQCSVSAPSLTMPAAAVTNVAVTCADQSFSLGGAITGLGAASGLVLTNNGADSTTILANATTFNMHTAVPYGAAYNVAVAHVPLVTQCTVAQGASTMPANDVSSVNVACSPGAESVLWSLGNTADGSSPATASLIQATDGNFYGMTPGGGTNGNGTVFKITPAGVETVIWSFGGSGDGAVPEGSLLQGTDGNFYGMTQNGGATGYGSVFKITPAGVETVIWSFTGSFNGDGAAPQGSLIQASDGNLYGMTFYGGVNNSGAIFSITTDGSTETVMHSFGGANDGSYPIGSLLQANDGNLYGLTDGGGTNNNGAVVKITLAGTESVLWSFAAGTADGQVPHGSLIQGTDGSLYGTTTTGGAQGDGAIFSITLAGTESVIHSFSGNDGSFPTGSLIQATDGNLYGMTVGGGTVGNGVVFQMTLAGVESVLYSFSTSSADGHDPSGDLVVGSDGYLYGMTNSGGAYNNTVSGIGGTVFKIN